jgi:hypothetical protein
MNIHVDTRVALTKLDAYCRDGEKTLPAVCEAA